MSATAKYGSDCRVSRPGAARVDPDRGLSAAGLTPGTLPLDALLEVVLEQPFPKAARPLGVIRGELDQRQPRVGHPSKGTARSSTISACPHPARPDPSSSPTAPGSPCSSSPCRAACDRRPAIPRRCSPGSPATAPRAPARCSRGWSVTPGRSRCPTRPPHTERAPGQRPLGRRRAGARRSSAPRGTRRWPDALDTRRPDDRHDVGAGDRAARRAPRVTVRGRSATTRRLLLRHLLLGIDERHGHDDRFPRRRK
jgi:hypothetical protein